jgi:hypothetical protein
MPKTGMALEREAARRLPELLADLFGESSAHFDVRPGEGSDRRVDMTVSDGRGVRWVVEVKGTSGPWAG